MKLQGPCHTNIYGLDARSFYIKTFFENFNDGKNLTMKLTNLPYIGTALSGAASSLTDTFFENSDGRARGRRCAILIAYLSAVVTNLTAGTYFTGLMLAMGVGVISNALP